MLDEVKFIAHTDNNEDLVWLNELVATSESYSHVHVSEPGRTAGQVRYGKIWDEIARKGELYIKLDDDVVSFC